jgi:hypothetical protein
MPLLAASEILRVPYDARMRERNGAAELGFIVAALAIAARFLDVGPALAMIGLLAATVAAGTGRLIGDWRPWRNPLTPVALPMLAAFSIAGVGREVPAQAAPLVFLAGWLALWWIVDLELLGFFAPPAGEMARAAAERPRTTTRIRTRRRPESELPQLVVEEVVDAPPEPPHPRQFAVRLAAIGLAFAGFVAVGGIVPDALPGAAQPATARELAGAVLLDAAVAAVVGYRIAALLVPGRADRIVRVLALIQYGVPAALAGWAFREVSMPRLFGPALLTLIVYAVTAMRESPDPIVLNRRLLQELGLLLLVGAAAAAWGLMLR